MKTRIKLTCSVIMCLALLMTTVLSGSVAIPALAEDLPGHVETVVADGKRNIDFNEGWQFYLATRSPQIAGGSGGSGFAQFGLLDAGDYTTAQIVDPAFDDSSWRTLTVPHDFAIEGEKVTNGAGSAQAYMQGGLGYYRKKFVLPEAMQGKRITIDFEGVYQNSIVYLNGREIGNYPSGYTGFAYDITEDVTFGANYPKVLVVKVQNMQSSGRWYTGSGIVRPVHLVVTDPVRFVRNGINLTAPTLESTFTASGRADLQVNANLYSDATNGRVSMTTTVYDANGAAVATQSTASIDINPTTLANLTSSVNVPSVKLWYPWNLGDPYLYTVKNELYYEPNGGEGERLVDTVETKYGFRWFSFDSFSSSDLTKGGLYVNGQHTKINGVDLHHDSGSLGAVSIKDAYERQFTVLKSMGVNSYRTSHCPPSKQVIEVCSEMGIIVMEEAYDGWGSPKATYDFGNFFFIKVPEDWRGLAPNGLLAPPFPAVNYAGAQYSWSDWVVREMVSRDINEASVLMWSIGNEIRGCGTRPSWYDGTKYSDRSGLTNTGVGANTINEFTESVRLAEEIKALDGTRKIAMGGDQQRTAPQIETTWGRVNRYLDGYGLNYNTAASINTLMDRFNNTFFFESESSSQTSSRGKYLDPSVKNSGINQTPGRRGGSNYDNDFASWTMSNEYGLKKDRDNKAFTGQYIWSGFDYLGEPTPYGVYPVGVSSFGAIDTAGFPKDSYYLFRSQFTDKDTNPMVHLLPGNWNDWREGEEVEVWVNSNVQTVELFLNGESIGTKSFDVKRTAYGREYYETSELNPDDKTWGDTTNPGGYTSTNATIVSASGDSAIAEGAKFGRLHLTWKIPYEPGELVAKAYTNPSKTTLVAEDRVATAGLPYTVQMKANKEVITADGRSLTYVECTVVDEDGNYVMNAENLFKFDVTGGAIVGVDNGQQESNELYKWGNVERNTHSERSAYAGKVLVILQSNKGETGMMNLKVSSDGLKTADFGILVTEDGTGTNSFTAADDSVFSHITMPQATALKGTLPTLPGFVMVNYTSEALGNYAVKTLVEWNNVTSADVADVGTVTVEGVAKAADGDKTAVVVLHVVEPEDARAEIAANPGLTKQNHNIFRFSDVPAGSDLLKGALATASFTGDQTISEGQRPNTITYYSYPNNMLFTGDLENWHTWSNSYNRGASVLLPSFTNSRPYENVEFFWANAKLFNEIKLYLSTESNFAMPESFNVEYWNGAAWVEATGVSVDKATTSGAATTLTFDAVNSDRVRVDMKNATPYSTTTGDIRIFKAEIFGWDANLSDIVYKGFLEAAIAEAEEIDGTIYTPASYEALTSAMSAGQTVFDNADATQEEVDAATQAIQNAIAGLTEPADKSALQELVDSTAELNEETYTADSWAALQAALADANGILDDPNAAQEDVDSALPVLQAAIDALAERGSDPPSEPSVPSDPSDPGSGDPSVPGSSSDPADPSDPGQSVPTSPGTSQPVASGGTGGNPYTADFTPLTALLILFAAAALAVPVLLLKGSKKRPE